LLNRQIDYQGVLPQGCLKHVVLQGMKQWPCLIRPRSVPHQYLTKQKSPHTPSPFRISSHTLPSASGHDDRTCFSLASLSRSTDKNVISCIQPESSRSLRRLNRFGEVSLTTRRANSPSHRTLDCQDHRTSPVRFSLQLFLAWRELDFRILR
jgi:hypothetical protein